MRPRFLTILALLSVLGTFALPAEDVADDWFYRAWQTEDGLPDNSISGVVQSPDGYLWIGTNGGAIRFNGHEFNPLPLRNIPALPSRQVRAMLLDRSGQLWLGMERGPVIRISGNTFRAFRKEDGLARKRTISMTDDPEGRVWIAYSNSVSRFDGDEITTFGPSHGIPLGQDASIACDRRGQVWLANRGMLGRLTDDGFELVRDFKGVRMKIAPAGNAGLWIVAGSELLSLDPAGDYASFAKLPDGVIVNNLFEDRTGAVWVGTEGSGLLRVDEGSVQRVPTSHATIDSLTEDREGNIWAGTGGGGLNLIRPRPVNFTQVDDGLPFSSVRSTTIDTKGRVWAVSANGLLAFRDAGQWQPFGNPTEDSPQFTCVTASPDGGVWAGTFGSGLLHIDQAATQSFGAPDGLSSRFIRSMLTTRNGDLWIASDEPDQVHRLRDGILTKLSTSTKFNAIRGMAETADGTVWMGASDGVLLRVEGDRLVDESALDGPLDLSIRTLHATPDGSLWIGYAGDGLGHLLNGRYSRITTEEGLFDNYLSQILDDWQGSLWIASNRGLFQVSQAELLSTTETSPTSSKLRCRVFGRSEGIPSIQPSRDYAPIACRSPDGSLYFATHSGILEVRTDKIRENALPPPVHLEKVAVDNRIAALYQARSMHQGAGSPELVNLNQKTPQLVLDPGHEKLVIHFAALSLASPENVRLRYRLDPIDKTWEEVTNQRSVTFPRLPAGSYDFQVIGCNHIGIWNETGATLRIIVRPFFWETWWFRIGGGLLTAFAAGGLVSLGLRRKHKAQLGKLAAKRALEQERSRIARDIHDDLGASLTRITLLSQSSLPDQEGSSQEVLDQIHATAQHLMRSMEEVVWAVNPEHDTFDALANYLSNYGQSFLSIAGVRCRLEMPFALPEVPLSAQLRHNLFLAFKEALNNAVKHSEATEVRISLKLHTNDFTLKIEDDGTGIDPDPSPDPMRPDAGRGLANMKSRMDEIGGTCTLHSTRGQGTTVEFKVPFKISP